MFEKEAFLMEKGDVNGGVSDEMACSQLEI